MFIKDQTDFSKMGTISFVLRKKRMNLLVNLLKLDAEQEHKEYAHTFKILDVGGTAKFWEVLMPDEYEKYDITLLNLSHRSSEEHQNFSNIHCVIGDARCMPEFAENQFDLVFSNSVIEHVGTLRDQKMMADEIKRVGKMFFVQTPNRYFPIEPHFFHISPIFNFIPKIIKESLIKQRKKINTIEAKIEIDSIRLLNIIEMKLLFSDGVIYKERFFGLVKSIIVSNIKKSI